MKSGSNTRSHRLPTPAPSQAQLQDAIRLRATEIYERGGRIAGRDTENWVQAEAEILSEQSELPSQKLALVVRVNGVQYVGEYDQASADGYAAGEFASGDPVRVFFEGEKMLVKRPNGKILETRIVRKVE